MSVTVVARRIAAVPFRTAGETWREIADLLATPGTAGHGELLDAAGPAAMLITEEHTRDAPILVTADSGPQIRLYTLHGDRALDDGTDETPLPDRPADRPGWHLQFPCSGEDLVDVTTVLTGHPHISVRDVAEVAAATSSAGGASAARPTGRLVVDRSQLGEP